MQRKKKILLIDDEEVIRLSFERELQPHYHVTLASGSEEALTILSENRFDLIVTDLVMSGIGGLDLLKRVKSDCPEIGVIIITGYGEIQAVIEALRSGADDFLLKPFDVEELIKCIDSTLEKQDFQTKTRLYEKILSSTTNLMALVDKDGIYLEANEAYLRAYGRSRKDLIGCTLSEVAGSVLFDTKISQWLDSCFSGVVVQHLDLFRLVDQGVRSMLVTYSPVHSSGSERTSLAAISMTDVTDILQDSVGMRNNEERLRMVHSVSANGFMDYDLAKQDIYYCRNWNKLLGYGVAGLQKSGNSWQDLLHQEDKASTLNVFQNCLDGRTDTYKTEMRLQKTDGTWKWFFARGMVVERDKHGMPLRVIGFLSDIDDQKKMQQKFLQANKSLEQSTARQNKQLAVQNEKLTEANTALKVLLGERQHEIKEVEKRLCENVHRIVEPLIRRLQKTSLDENQVQLISEIEENLREITASFVTRLTSEYIGLSPMEIQVATHVRQGKGTKEIADILYLAPDTIGVHRKNIRKKLGLSNKAINLKTFLTSLTKE
jgi:PAS domain S-box-containing protein